MPFFSVIIPTFNRAVLLKRAVGSVLEQTFADFELIVVDDHSTDDTKSQVGSFDDPRIHYTLNERTKGSAGAKNTGIARAKAEWIAFLDDDDYWMPEKLEKQHRKIVRMEDRIGLVYTLSSDLKDGVLIKRRGTPLEGWMFHELLFNDSIGTASGVAVLKSAVKRVGGFDERFLSKVDTDLYVRIARQYRIAVIREVLAVRDLSAHNRISINAARKLNANLLYYEKYRPYLIRSMALKSRALCNIFANALVEGRWKHVLRTFPYALISVFYDSGRMRYLARRFRQAIRRFMARLRTG